ncbi:MAG: hypothetical protein WCT13_06150 [Patescibacteria group bacterium]
MAVDDRLKKAPNCLTIDAEYTFEQFDSILLFDAGSDGFKLKDENDNVIVVPNGTSISIAGQAGKAAGPITVVAPDTGTLNVSAIYFK